MFDVFKNRLEIAGILTTITALRISQGRSTEPIGSDLPVIKDALGHPLIPGSSVKGAMRSRLESFLRGIDASLAANPAIESEWAITNERLNGKSGIKKEVEQELERLYPKPNQSSARVGRKDELLTQAILTETDFASKVFGSPWIASKFQVQDLTVLPEDWFGQYQERDGVSIDRDTETAAEGKLYDFQVVPAGTPFQFRAIMENAEDYELGLLMVGLHQFESEQIPLGGGRSRGLGVVKLDLDEMIWICPSNPEELIQYLQNITQDRLQPYVKTNQEIQTLKANWTSALVNHLRQQISDNRVAVEEASSA